MGIRSGALNEGGLRSVSLKRVALRGGATGDRDKAGFHNSWRFTKYTDTWRYQLEC